MGNVGASELLLIFLVALLVFGAKRLPEIARGLGQGLREFRSATREMAGELHLHDLPTPPPNRPPAATPTPPPFTPAANADPPDHHPVDPAV